VDTHAQSGEFVFELPNAAPVPSILYDEHLKLTKKSRMAPFAGYLMPLWYSTISQEHQIVRTSAGIFDCTHMGILEVSGPDATDFLNKVATNDIDKLSTGAAQYSYILDAAGNILDDIIIYHRDKNKFMVVVNAANEPKIKAYLNALLNDQVIIDLEDSSKKLTLKPQIRDMRNPQTGSDCRVDIALQGPASKDVLHSLIGDYSICRQIENLKPFKFVETKIEDINCIVSATGYTGAKISFELFVHPEKAPQLWIMLLQKGDALGLKPCGLGSRDSLRIQAGLPLYGHELAGEFNISPFQAGYGWAVKLEKKFFIGKTPMRIAEKSYTTTVARLKLSGAKGIRPVRQHDAVLSENGCCIGYILSCAKAGDYQFALALIDNQANQLGNALGIYYLARNQRQLQQGKKQSVQKSEKLKADISAKVISRFEKF